MALIQPSKKKVAGAIGLGLAIVSPFLLTFTSGWEGTRYKTYRDIVGVPTVCEGITGNGVVMGKTYTRAECDKFLRARLELAGRGVLSCVKVPLNQHQYDAFADLAYNIGTGGVGNGGFCGSSIVTNLNQGNYTEACNRILLYNKAGGKVVQGLVNRRQEERLLCLSPVTK